MRARIGREEKKEREVGRERDGEEIWMDDIGYRNICSYDSIHWNAG